MAGKKRKRVYRWLCLLEDTLSVFRKWYEKFTPEWDAEEEADKAKDDDKQATSQTHESSHDL